MREIINIGSIGMCLLYVPVLQAKQQPPWGSPLYPLVVVHCAPLQKDYPSRACQMCIFPYGKLGRVLRPSPQYPVDSSYVLYAALS